MPPYFVLLPIVHANARSDLSPKPNIRTTRYWWASTTQQERCSSVLTDALWDKSNFWPQCLLYWLWVAITLIVFKILEWSENPAKLCTTSDYIEEGTISLLLIWHFSLMRSIVFWILIARASFLQNTCWIATLEGFVDWLGCSEENHSVNPILWWSLNGWRPGVPIARPFLMSL